ncbi:MAG: hypothetical protein ACJAXJ_002735 [Colwellia sp.]
MFGLVLDNVYTEALYEHISQRALSHFKKGNRMKLGKILVGFFAFTLVSGCASIKQGKEQVVSLSTLNNSDISNTVCTLKNDDGEWQVSGEKSILVSRDGDPLQVVCENSAQQGSAEFIAEFGYKWLAYNAIIDLCTISCAVDGVNGAFYQYPEELQIVMEEK